MERGGVGTVGKQHFTYLYSPAREKALTMRNILAAWRGSGLFPFNPNRVLADIPKPPAELTIPNAGESVEYRPQYKSMQTPAIPVSSETLESLLNIIKRVPNDKTSNRRKERLQQKVSSAALTLFAKNALLRDQNEFLTQINNEGRTRRVTKSTVLKTAKVMTWDVLEKARAEHAVKEASKAEKKAKKAARQAKKVTSITIYSETTIGRAKRGWKRKSTASEAADITEPKAKVVRRREEQVADAYRKIYALELDTQVQDVRVLPES